MNFLTISLKLSLKNYIIFSLVHLKHSDLCHILFIFNHFKKTIRLKINGKIENISYNILKFISHVNLFNIIRRDMVFKILYEISSIFGYETWYQRDKDPNPSVFHPKFSDRVRVKLNIHKVFYFIILKFI